MEKLTKEEKLQIMRQVADIASSVSQSKLTWNVSSLDALVDRLYTRMIDLIEGNTSLQKDNTND